MSVHQIATLEALGWTPFFEAQYQALTTPAPAPGGAPPARVAPARVAPARVAPARVAIEYQDRYQLLGTEAPVWAQLSGGLLREANADRMRRPAVGDWVGVHPAAGAGMATIVHLFERRTRFVRQAAGRRPGAQVVAANIDAVFVVTSFVQDFQPRRIERYLATVHESGARGVLVLNKVDLCPDPGPVIDEARAAAPGVPVLVVSAVEQHGLDALRADIGARETVALVGSSGVGKSTLINWLLGAEVQKTAPVRERDGRGRHTTTHRELIPMPGGGLLIDTPGMRELQLWTAAGALRETFSDIEELAARCRFRDCRHQGEPGCAVARALRQGALARDRFAGYLKLRAEAEASSTPGRAHTPPAKRQRR